MWKTTIIPINELLSAGKQSSSIAENSFLCIILKMLLLPAFFDFWYNSQSLRLTKKETPMFSRQLFAQSSSLNSRRSLRGVVLTNLAKKLPRRPPAKAREARFVDEGGVVAVFLLN